MNLTIAKYVTLRGNAASVDGREIFRSDATMEAPAFFSALYKHLGVDYRKFFKMDNLSKLGFLGAELLLAETDREEPKGDMSLILWNKSASEDADRTYQKTIAPGEEYFPSPADFVYTLPNIVTGEIAIRNKIFGETSFYISECFSAEQITCAVRAAFGDGEINCLICGWVEYLDGIFESTLLLVRRGAEGMEFNAENINQIYNK